MPEDTKQTNKPPAPSLQENLERYLAEKRQRQAVEHEKELLVRAQQVRTLQGMLGPVVTIQHKCSKCGHVDTVLDPRPIAPDDDYDTRM